MWPLSMASWLPCVLDDCWEGTSWLPPEAREEAGRASRPVRLSQLAAGRCGLGKQRWGCERRLLVALQLTQWLCASCADWPAPAQWPPGGHGPPRGRAAARTHPRCAALTRRGATCPIRVWRLSAWIRREPRRTVEPQLRARKVVCIPLLIPQPEWDKYH